MDDSWAKNYPSAEGILEESIDDNTSLKKILRLVGNGKSVADFGCATGYLASLLKKHGCTVTGIEINSEAASLAEQYCDKVLVVDLDFTSVNDILDDEIFDVLVFGDVLEHLRNPWKTLREAKRLLKPGGYIVASIPNVAHGAVRLALLKGEFKYEEFGLLDETHLRFFTRTSICEMFASTGYVIDEWDTTTSDVFLGQWIPKVRKDDFDHSLVDQILAEEDSNVLQFVVRATVMPETLEERLSRTKTLLKEVANELHKSLNELKSVDIIASDISGGLQAIESQSLPDTQNVEALQQQEEQFEVELLLKRVADDLDELEDRLKSSQAKIDDLSSELQAAQNQGMSDKQSILVLQQQNKVISEEFAELLLAKDQELAELLVEKDAELHRLQHHLSETFENIEGERQRHQAEINDLQRHLAETFQNIELERLEFHRQCEALGQGYGIPVSFFLFKKGQRLVSRVLGRQVNRANLKLVLQKLKRKLLPTRLKAKLLKLNVAATEKLNKSPQGDLLALSGVTTEFFWDKVLPLIPSHDALLEIGENPQISILTPTWNSSLDWFLETALSVLNQTFKNWEWCIVDDGSQDDELRDLLKKFSQLHPRVKVLLESPGGISAATNQALSMASGEYICFLDHDDALASFALATLVQKLDEGFDVVYSDEDKIDASGKRYVEPFYKPDWSPEYLRGVMYVGHLLGVRKELVLSVGGFRSAFDGVQDYDLMLRLAEKTSKIGHISEILYHWRKIPGSIAADINAKSKKIEQLQEDAVNEHLQRCGLAGKAMATGSHRLKIVPNRERPDHPLISIIIPTKDAPYYLERCLSSLFKTSSYPNFEVILVDNETTDEKALSIMEAYEVKRVMFPDPFNYSRANNLGATHAQGDYLVFLNNDTEIVSADWLQNLLFYAEQENIGAVGALLLFPDRTVQHAGVVIGFRGTADHIMRGFPHDSDGYAGSLRCAREVSAVTAACLMMKKQDFELVEGFNEHFFTHYQDVDLCLKLIKAGKTNIFTPFSVLIHHESKTRKSYYDWGDRLLLLDQFEDDISTGDRYYNKHFSLDKHDYSIKG